MARSRITLVFVSIAVLSLLLVLSATEDALPEDLDLDAVYARGVETMPTSAAAPSTELAIPLATQDSSSTRTDEGAAEAGACAIDGRITDTDGLPLEDVVLTLSPKHAHGVAKSDSEGNFAFHELESNHYSVSVEKDSLPADIFPPKRPSSARRGSASSTTVEIRLFRAGTLHGSVFNADGEPRARALAVLDSSNQLSRKARTNANGGFTIPKLHPGEYVLQVSNSSPPFLEAGTTPVPLKFELKGGEVLTLEPLVCGAGGHVLQGRVVDSEGVPAAGMFVSVKSEKAPSFSAQWNVTTDAAGRFLMGRLPSQEVELFIEGPTAQHLGIIREYKKREPLLIDLAGATPTKDLGDLQVEFTRVYSIAGSVRVDPQWAEKQELGRYVIAIRNPTNKSALERPPLLESIVIGSSRSANQNFWWSCDATDTPIDITLEVVLQCDSGKEYVRALRLQPHDPLTKRITVQFPR